MANTISPMSWSRAARKSSSFRSLPQALPRQRALKPASNERRQKKSRLNPGKGLLDCSNPLTNEKLSANVVVADCPRVNKAWPILVTSRRLAYIAELAVLRILATSAGS